MSAGLVREKPVKSEGARARLMLSADIWYRFARMGYRHLIRLTNETGGMPGVAAICKHKRDQNPTTIAHAGDCVRHSVKK